MSSEIFLASYRFAIARRMGHPANFRMDEAGIETDHQDMDKGQPLPGSFEVDSLPFGSTFIQSRPLDTP